MEESELDPKELFDLEDELDVSEFDVSEANGPKIAEKAQPGTGNLIVGLPFSTLTQPASYFEGFVPPVPEVTERAAIKALMESMGELDDTDDYIELELESFSIYLDSNTYPNELRPLQHLIARTVHSMYFDGILRHGDLQFYLRRVPFQKLPVGNYGESNHSVGDQIWILSELNEYLGREIYYKLGSPAPEYRRFHVPFLWIADLGKHVIDYCEHRRDQNERAILYDFKSKFSAWLLSKHQFSVTFDKWYAANGTADFRVAVNANIDYIYEQAYGLDHKIATWHHFWKEVKTLDRYKPNMDSYRPAKVRRSSETGLKPRKGQVPDTVVTPYVYDLFSHMVFGKLLEFKRPSMSGKAKKTAFIKRAKSLSVQPTSFRSKKRSATDQSTLVERIETGDVISTLPDDATTTDTRWKSGSSAHYEGEYRWFGLVQKVHTSPRGKRSFDVLWLYQPIDTPCSVMKYPWANELFLSDNCTCHPRINKVKEHEVLSTHEVEWFGNNSTTAEFFVRQTYLASECRWTSLRKSHLVCGEETADSTEPHKPSQYSIGDAVLVETRSMQLETFIIEGFSEEGGAQLALMRHLLRRKDVDKAALSAPPNELVYSQQLINKPIRKISRRCLVRVFLVGEEIPTPYNRDGTGDAYFITHEEIEVHGRAEYRPLKSKVLGSLREGFNPFDEIPKLQGLDLFCGGGNLGRGIEEGGAVEMRWTNDIWHGAIHTYMANTEPGRCTPFLGSVDNLLGLALDGTKGVPAPGDVHFISAGSPCPGFSLLTIDKTTIPQRKNQSLIASFASFVDFYRPLYGVLENVPNMVNKNLKNSCVFSQLVCAIVGLGYQVQILYLDAWSFGSAQRRSRVFLSFTAAGLTPPKAPKASHSHPDNVRLSQLGRMSSGLPFDSRKIVPTPFKFVSMKEAVGNLPDIQDGKADFCVGHPDHRLSIGYSAVIRKQLQCIPTRPFGMDFSKAWYGAPGIDSVMTKAERELFPEKGIMRVQRNSKGWGRVKPNGLVGTLATCCLPTDARVGHINHWEQNRPLSILEARRAQGFLDHEVIVGSRADHFKVVGNSVARHVSLVLGMVIREAWANTMLGIDGDVEQRLQIQAETHESLNGTLPDYLTDSDVDDDLQVQLQVHAESHVSPDETSTEASSDLLGMPSPFSGVYTPATSESLEPSNGENERKRVQSICVEVPSTKKRRLTVEPEDTIMID
ncbi:S-adenosyl-L-methionine-dependent methyltransferase [Xylaria intraflava]|nr:S-adenosyl-L-methionine-dependent methyltransferase [Xylaria intraflava]